MKQIKFKLVEMKHLYRLRTVDMLLKLAAEHLLDADGSFLIHKIGFWLQRQMIYEEMGIIPL